VRESIYTATGEDDKPDKEDAKSFLSRKSSSTRAEPINDFHLQLLLT